MGDSVRSGKMAECCFGELMLFFVKEDCFNTESMLNPKEIPISIIQLFIESIQFCQVYTHTHTHTFQNILKPGGYTHLDFGLIIKLAVVLHYTIICIWLKPVPTSNLLFQVNKNCPDTMNIYAH